MGDSLRTAAAMNDEEEGQHSCREIDVGDIGYDLFTPKKDGEGTPRGSPGVNEQQHMLPPHSPLTEKRTLPHSSGGDGHGRRQRWGHHPHHRHHHHHHHNRPYSNRPRHHHHHHHHQAYESQEQGSLDALVTVGHHEHPHHHHHHHHHHDNGQQEERHSKKKKKKKKKKKRKRATKAQGVDEQGRETYDSDSEEEEDEDDEVRNWDWGKSLKTTSIQPRGRAASRLASLRRRKKKERRASFPGGADQKPANALRDSTLVSAPNSPESKIGGTENPSRVGVQQAMGHAIEGESKEEGEDDEADMHEP